MAQGSGRLYVRQYPGGCGLPLRRLFGVSDISGIILKVISMLNHAFRVWLLCAVFTRNYTRLASRASSSAFAGRLSCSSFPFATNSGKRPLPANRFLGDCVACDAQPKERKCRKVTNANGGPDQARRRVSVTEDKRNSSP